MLDADGQAHQAGGNAGAGQFGIGQQVVGGFGGDGGQRLAVADVHQPLEQLQGVVKALGAGAAAVQLERQQARDAAGAQVARGVAMVRVAGVGHMLDVAHQRVGLQKGQHRAGVAADALDAQGQRFQPLQQLKGGVGRQRGTGIAQQHGARTGHGRGLGVAFGEHHLVEGRVGPGQLRVALGVGLPVEAPTIDDQPPHGHAVAADVLGGRVHDQIGPVFKRPDQQRRGAGVVHHHGHAVGMGLGGDGGQVGHIARRIADGLDEHGLGLGGDGLAQGVPVLPRHYAAADAAALQHVCDQVV
ncbi:Uncharacterised protein [Comamonas aquatica]|nr:Uncharacterised protein [Comamonas aquatica]